jgi:hypothetical protein
LTSLQNLDFMAKTRSTGRLAKVTVLIPLIKDFPVSNTTPSPKKPVRIGRVAKPRVAKSSTLKRKRGKVSKAVSDVKSQNKETSAGIISSVSNYIASLFGL